MSVDVAMDKPVAASTPSIAPASVPTSANANRDSRIHTPFPHQGFGIGPRWHGVADWTRICRTAAGERGTGHSFGAVEGGKVFGAAVDVGGRIRNGKGELLRTKDG